MITFLIFKIPKFLIVKSYLNFERIDEQLKRKCNPIEGQIPKKNKPTNFIFFDERKIVLSKFINLKSLKHYVYF